MQRFIRKLSHGLGYISVRNKIFLLNAVIIVISLSVFAYFANQISSEAIIHKATQNASRELALIDKSLSTLAINAEDSIRILSTNDRLQRALETYRNQDINPMEALDIKRTLSSVISSMVTPNTHYAAASIMTANQELFEIGYADNNSVRQVITDDMVKAITKKKVPTWINLFYMNLKDSGKAHVFTIAKPIIGLDTGRMLGIAALYLKESDIAAIYLENAVNKNDQFLILDNDMQIISSRNKADLFKNLSDVQVLDTDELVTLKETGSIIKYITGKQHLLTLRQFEKLDWQIISMIPLEEITMETKGITKLIVILGFSCLLFAFLANYLLSYTITRPILSLARLMKEIHRGNINQRTNVRSKDEIGQLGEGFNTLMNKVSQLLDQVYLEQKTKHEIEFRLLQSQIKPHFLYNTIETIISFIKLDMKDNAMLTARNLAGFYRISLSKGSDIITVREEVQLITSYLTIQKLRYIDIDYQIDISTEILDFQIPKLTLQPLVENAIYHGLKPMSEKGVLTIHGSMRGADIILEVADNGVGMAPETVKNLLMHGAETSAGESFGLGSVQMRIRLMYGEPYGVSIESQTGVFTKVTVCLPAKKSIGGAL